MSEESEDDRARLAADRVWIVAPLDGTREYGEHETDHAWRTDFAVQVALWSRAGGLTAAAVALPGRHLLYRSDTVTTPPRSHRRGALRIAVSRSRPRPSSRRCPRSFRSRWFRWDRQGPRRWQC
ncbi:FIG domain-containing protein [Tessaracoccus coleopterorum]|uniref:inositol monophosphatase family protein n=1 Tax=Tessaracoccus coleopterorum TaxID=2714950 RepID=UPI001E465658